MSFMINNKKLTLLSKTALSLIFSSPSHKDIDIGIPQIYRYWRHFFVPSFEGKQKVVVIDKTPFHP